MARPAPEAASTRLGRRPPPVLCLCAALAAGSPAAPPPARAPQALRDAAALVQGSLQRAGLRQGEGGGVYHLHIPRTAGTSFAADAQRILLRDIVSKEGCYDWRFDFPGVGRVALMLRSPREHVLSQYLYCSEGHINFMTQMPRPNKFREWVEAWAGHLENHTVVGDYSGRSSIQREEVLQTFVTFTSLPFRCYNPINLQSQHLTCVRPFNFPREVDAEGAITNMQEAWFVGLVEAYQESLCLLHAKATGRLPGFCDCRNATSWASFNPSHTAYHRRSTRTSRNVAEHPRDVLQLVDGLTTVDRMLYKAAVQRFVFEVREVEREHRTRILCYDTALVQRSLQDPLRMHFATYLREAGVRAT